MATIDKRSKSGWRARVRIPGFGLKTRSFATKEQAQKWARLTEATLRSGLDEAIDLEAEPTLGEALELYAERETPKKKGAPQELRRIRVLRELPMADLKLSDLIPQHFTDFKTNRQAQGASANTIRLELYLFSALFKTARIEWGLSYLQNPISAVRMPRQGKGRDRRLNAEESKRFEQTLQDCGNPLVRQAIDFATHTGARKGELLKLMWADVDLKARTVVFRDTKNGDDRTVPLSQPALDVLGQVMRGDSPRVFRISCSTLDRAWGAVRDQSGLENFRFHDLRHEATSRLFERGLTTMEVQSITGHKTLSMLSRYTHIQTRHMIGRLDATESADEVSPPAPSRGSHHRDSGLTEDRHVQSPEIPTENVRPSSLTGETRLGQRTAGKVIQFQPRRRSC